MIATMSVICVSVSLLCSAVVGVSSSTQALSPAPGPAPSPGPAPTPLSARLYRHTHPDTGAPLLCDKCPAGAFVSRHCTPTSVRECGHCADGTFTRGENGAGRCHRCRPPCPPGQAEKVACAATQDRVCACPPGSFAEQGGASCRPHALCPPGAGVRRRGGEREDVRCKPCARGTFSDSASSVLRCRTHTDCLAQGLPVLEAGTAETDNVCGAAAPHPSSSSSSSSSSPAPPSVQPPFEPPPPSPSEESPQRDYSLPAGVVDLELSLSAMETLAMETLPILSPAGSAPRDGPPPEDDAPHRGGSPGPGPAPSLAPPRDPIHTPPPPHRKHPAPHNPHPAAVEGGAGRDQGGGASNPGYRPTRRGSPRPSGDAHSPYFDINEHLPWMTVLLLLLALLVIVACSVRRSSRALKKGPAHDPASIVEKALQRRTPGSPRAHAQERWIYHSNGQGVDILKLVSAQIGAHWMDMYQSLASATEREVAAFSSGYGSDPERAYAALQHWTLRDADANLAKLISALHRQRRTDVVEHIRCVMEDNPQFNLAQLMTSVNVSQSLSPVHRPVSPGVAVEGSPVDRTKGFFPDESEPLLRCDSTSSKDSALSRTGSFITKEKKDTVLRQVRLDPCDLQPVFDDMLHILTPEELRTIEAIPMAEDKLDRLFEIAGVKSQEASQILLDSVYSHLPDLL